VSWRFIIFSVALSKTTKRVIISLAVGTLFTFVYLSVGILAIYYFYRTGQNTTHVRNVVPYWPLELPERAYYALGRNPVTLSPAIHFLLILLNIPLYGSLIYGLLWIVDRFRGTRKLVEIDEPPAPPTFDA
jgi:hypothetical protein